MVYLAYSRTMAAFYHMYVSSTSFSTLTIVTHERVMRDGNE